MERGSGHNAKLDLWKCVAIYSVIFIHILLPGQIGVAVNCLARFAVPLFFLSAGFFSWRSPPRVLARRTVRTAGLLLFACLALLGLGCAMARHGGASMGAYLLGRFTWANAASLVLWQLFPLPYSWPLWFLAALLMIYLMWWGLTALLRGRLPHRLLAVLALGLLAVHLVLGEGRSLQGLAVDSVRIRNVWLDGLPFFLLGTWMGSQRERIEALRPGWLWLGGAAGSLLALWERSRTEFLDLHVGTVLAAVCVMAACVAGPAVKSPVLRRTACRCGRELTFYIFAFHVPIYGVMKEWSDTVPGFAWAMERSWLLPFLVAVLSTLLAIGLNGGAAWLRRRIRGGTYEDH